MPSVTEDIVVHTTCTFSRSIRADDLGKSRPAQSMGGLSLPRIEREKVHIVCSSAGFRGGGATGAAAQGPLLFEGPNDTHIFWF